MRAALLLTVVACSDPAVVIGVTYGPPVYEEELQGHWLLGSVPDGLAAADGDHVAVLGSMPGGRRISVNAGSLELRDPNGVLLGAGTDPVLAGLVLRSTGGAAVKLVAAVVDPDVHGPAYQLLYEAAPGSWSPYCADGELAVAMQGTWSTTGFHRDDADVTFGCRDGTSFKCFTWGYVPGLAGTDAWRAHQACTRMARADVCGDGTPHTRELTPIVIRDYLPGYHPGPDDAPRLLDAPSLPAPPDQHFYESAWAAGEDVGAVCLSRTRWASLPVGGCAALPDPRVTPTARYCEDMLADELVASGALLANASKTQDMYLHRWRRPATGDVVATVRGFYSQGSDLVAPFEGYTEYLGPDAILLRNLPGSIALTDVIEVFSKGTFDRVLEPDPALTRADPRFEGYLLVAPGADRVPFDEYDRGGVDRLTSADPEDPAYVLVSSLSYALAP